MFKGDTNYENVADVCKWLKENYGYGCNGKKERWIWTTYMKI
jgi:hypothetical protein